MNPDSRVLFSGAANGAESAFGAAAERHGIDDDTVEGGTGWGAEFEKLCNKPFVLARTVHDPWRS